jgi:hypothetical protein
VIGYVRSEGKRVEELRILFSAPDVYWDDPIKQELGRACSIIGRGEKYAQNFYRVI